MGLGGLIAGALGGAAKGYTEVAETNLKKDAELDLKKQLLDAQAAKDLAIDEIKRNRDVSDIGRTSAATAAAALANAPTTAQAAVAGKVAEATAIKGSGLSALQAENTAADLAANKNNVTEKARLGQLCEVQRHWVGDCCLLLDDLLFPRLSHRIRPKRHCQHIATVGRVHATIPHILFAL